MNARTFFLLVSPLLLAGILIGIALRPSLGGGLFWDDRVRDEWQRLDYALFRADWTRRDESIRAELARFGRAGVPLYLIYRPSEPDRPTLLPEILSVDRVLDALRSSG